MEAEQLSVRDKATRLIGQAVDHLLAFQHEAGHWRGELEGDSILQSEYILLKWILGHEDDPRLPRIAAHLRRQQQADGTWVQYPGAAMDLSATVKGYLALKLMGEDPRSEPLRRARARIRAGGGAERCNSFTKFYLAALGQIRWSAQPIIPPEIVFLPRWSYFHLNKVSAWTRTMILPLAIITTHRPVRELKPEQSIAELYLSERRRHRPAATQDRPHPFWSRLFLAGDRALKGAEPLGRRGPTRGRALRWIENWLLQHMENSDGLGAIFPPMVYIQIALRCLGYPDDHPVLVKARQDLDDLMIEDSETGEIRLQPCLSPVWDTGLAAFALTEAGLDGQHEPMRRCADWLIRRECRGRADWAANVRGEVEPAGWFFEHRNPWYPDCDDTAMVAMALTRIGGKSAEAAAGRGVNWLLAMQNDDGAWAAFDRTKDRPILEHVPFADHNAIQDPSCADITGRVLEGLGWHGYRADHPAVARAISYIRSQQEADGAWEGRWGVNYVYGTFQILCGLASVEQDMTADWIQLAAQWLREHQNPDGSFGETPTTYEDPSLRGTGPPTASQTAWGAMGLMSVTGPDDEAVERAIRWLLETSVDRDPGVTWDEPGFTGTGFPRVFYLRYHLYRHYFPLMALGRYLRGLGEPEAGRGPGGWESAPSDASRTRQSA